MLRYDKSDDGKFRKYVIAGAAFLALLSGMRCACSSREDSVDEKVKAVLSELQNDHSLLERNYGTIANLAEQGISKDYADRLVRKGLEVLEGNIEKDTYLVMFEEIRQKAEQHPELIGHFGIKARAYSERQVVEKYISLLKSGKNPFKAFGEREPSLGEMIELGRQYLMEGE